MYRDAVKPDSTCEGEQRSMLRLTDCLICDCFRRLGLAQLGLQEAETAMTAQNLDGFLLHGGRSDTQVLKAGQVGVLHVR